MPKTRIMIIDEQPYFRAGVRQTLLQEKDFEVMEAEHIHKKQVRSQNGTIRNSISNICISS